MTLKRWVETVATEPLPATDRHERVHLTSPFPVDPRLNAKLALWVGDLTTLDCDAIVNPTNESFSDSSAFAHRLFARAGKPLIDHVRRQLQTCRTGDLKLSEGFGLPCRHVLHTVGPKYKPQFHSAAETALFTCYQRVLNSVLDHRWSNIAIPPIHTGKLTVPNFPLLKIIKFKFKKI
jgi:O-acetyl-ADP-ribose deacetylase (regulator of RNase III)